MEVQELRIDEIKVDEEITIQHADDFADYSLDDLAQQINDGHQGLQVATRRLAVHVAQVGAWLTAAKAKCQHGEWLPWLDGNCAEITQRTATNYMGLYHKAMSNQKSISDLTPTQAYKELGVVRNNNGSDWYQSSDSDDWWTPQWVLRLRTTPQGVLLRQVRHLEKLAADVLQFLDVGLGLTLYRCQAGIRPLCHQFTESPNILSGRPITTVRQLF